MSIPVTIAVRPSRMNNTEAAYASRLSLGKRLGEIGYFAFEPLRLRLAGGAFYKPDFIVASNGKPIEFHEVKGFWREAARVRIRVAAELHPWARFVAVRLVKGEWVREEF